MLRTTTTLENVWVPPPAPVAGYYKKVKKTVTTDLNSGHGHKVAEVDWTPEGASEEELNAAKKIDAMNPPRRFAATIGRPLHETPEQYHARTAGQPGAMDVHAATEEGRAQAAAGPDDPNAANAPVDPDAEEAGEGEGDGEDPQGDPEAPSRRRKKKS